jgi:hypothetical protein
VPAIFLRLRSIDLRKERALNDDGAAMKQYAIASLLLVALTVPALAEETTQDIIAAQIRSQGYRCNHPKTATRDVEASRPGECAWRVQCGWGSYLVKLIPHMAAKVEHINQ